MLGMMNSPTDAVDFYASPTTAATANLSSTDFKAFTEVKDRAHISYTKDGRKLVDGKLEEESECLADPLKMWNRLILNRMAAAQIPKEEMLSRKPSKSRKLFHRVNSSKPDHPAASVRITQTVTVTGGNPQVARQFQQSAQKRV